MLAPRSAFLRVSHGEAWLGEVVSDTCSRAAVPSRPLELQALMHLPRLADRDGRIEIDVAACELERLAHQIPPLKLWEIRTDVQSARGLILGPVDESDVRRIYEQFHYLRSHRLKGRHFGAFAPDEPSTPVAVVATTPVDVPSLARFLAPDTSFDEVRVVARVFSFPCAPRNTLSRLLAFVAHAEARDLGSRQLITYVNPNLGFSGASYLASGWAIAGVEPGTVYRYVDARYTTDRELERRFGFSDDRRLRQALRSRFGRSRMPLRPLLVFSRVIGRSLRRKMLTAASL